VLVAAAVCPAGPVLVPEVAQGAAGELDGCRDACHDVIATMLAQRADVVVVVGAGSATREHPAGTPGSLAPVGVALSVRLGTSPGGDLAGGGRVGDDGVASLPLSLALGAWLLAPHTAVARLQVTGLETATDEPVASCLDLGRGVADMAGRVALLVIADGTARRGPAAPGYTDERSAAVDEAWTDALAAGRPDELTALDADLADALMMVGRAPLQVLAGAADARQWRGALVWQGDPYGVQYAVASWLPRDD
jgi:hypothetical protein